MNKVIINIFNQRSGLSFLLNSLTNLIYSIVINLFFGRTIQRPLLSILLRIHFMKQLKFDPLMISVFIYLSRAFDTISHEILFNKLYVYGIRGLALDWINNYLQNRKQFFVYNNAQSSFENIVMGSSPRIHFRSLAFHSLS